MTNIAFKQAHSGNYRRAARGKEDIRYLVIHFTANDGDTAKNNADYFARAKISTSAHYFVDENEVWQSVRDARISHGTAARAASISTRTAATRTASALSCAAAKTARNSTLCPRPCAGRRR